MYNKKAVFPCETQLFFGVNRVTEVWIKNLGQAFLKVDLNFKFLGSTFMPKILCQKVSFLKFSPQKAKNFFNFLFFVTILS